MSVLGPSWGWAMSVSPADPMQVSSVAKMGNGALGRWSGREAGAFLGGLMRPEGPLVLVVGKPWKLGSLRPGEPLAAPDCTDRWSGTPKPPQL